MKTNLFLFAGALIIGLSSCDNQVKNERLKRIDSLGIHLNHVGDVLAKVDSIALANRNAEISRNETWLWDNVEDTLEAQPGIVIGDYFRTKKYQSKVLKRFNEVKKELEYSESQLQTLRDDVKNSFYSKEEFTGYFNTEAEAVAKLVKASDELNAANENVVTRYEKLSVPAKEIFDSIKTVIYGNEAVHP